MLFMLISAALAAPAVDELSALTQAAGPVVGAVSCAPLDAVLDGLRGSAILKGVLARPELQEAGSALFRDLLDPTRTQGLGLDLQGSFSVVEAGGVETTRVSFSGTPAQAEALLPDAKGSPWTAAGPAAWTHTADESRWTEAHLEASKLVMARRSKRGGERHSQRSRATKDRAARRRIGEFHRDFHDLHAAYGEAAWRNGAGPSAGTARRSGRLAVFD